MKAIQILTTGIELLEKAKATNPLSLKEIQSKIDIYAEAIKELEEIQKNLTSNNKLVQMMNEEMIELRKGKK